MKPEVFEFLYSTHPSYVTLWFRVSNATRPEPLRVLEYELTKEYSVN